jgi:hypothetical protein
MPVGECLSPHLHLGAQVMEYKSSSGHNLLSTAVRSSLHIFSVHILGSMKADIHFICFPVSPSVPRNREFPIGTLPTAAREPCCRSSSSSPEAIIIIRNERASSGISTADFIYTANQSDSN